MSMIQPTDEMIETAMATKAFEIGRGASEFHATRRALAAVLAIVERDYEPRRCDESSWLGHRCTKPRGHESGHQHRWSGVVWP